MDFSEIQRHLSERTQESQTIEFKAGAALARGDKHPSELVKDVSGMANAAGGLVVYGIAEEKDQHGIKAAARLDPVRDDSITADWVTQMLKGKTGPPLQLFDVHEIAVPAAEGGGRVIVVAVKQAATAHQSSFDRKYYQRAGRTTEAMYDFQIRDVMGRRTGPVISISVRRFAITRTADRHQYSFVTTLSNVGALSLERWIFEVDLPRLAFDMKLVNNVGSRMETARVGNVDVQRFTYWPGGAAGRIPAELHPGQQLTLGDQIGIEGLPALVTQHNWGALDQLAPPIRWRLFMPNSQPTEGEMPFNEWCDF